MYRAFAGRRHGCLAAHACPPYSSSSSAVSAAKSPSLLSSSSLGASGSTRVSSRSYGSLCRASGAALTRTPIEGPLYCASRCYTPIYKDDVPPSDHTAPLRRADEETALWAAEPFVPSLEAGAAFLLRCGNDPVVSSTLPALSPLLSEAREAGGPSSANVSASVSSSSSSPFAHVEDYMGTNMIAGTAELVSESAAVWSDYFRRRALGRLRQSRRTAQNFLGVANSDAAAAAATLSSSAGAFTDEADSPATPWPQDSYFREVSYLAQRHLKVKTGNLLLLEQAIWEKSEPEPFLAFFDAYQHQTQTRIPLPAPAVFYLEGDARKQWAERYLPVAKEAREFFDGVLAPALKKNPKLLETAVAPALRAAHAILLERHQRQTKAGIKPDFSPAAAAAAMSPEAAEARRAYAAAEVERERRAVMEAEYDPEDSLDASEEWKAEHARLLKVWEEEPLTGASFTLRDFWLHTVRREALETQHVYDMASVAAAAAAARVRLYEESADYAAVLKGVEDSYARGQLDLRAAVLKPYPTPVWCKLHYAKFGAAGLVQRTTTGSRQLLFHAAASTQEVAATATLYYATKPLSSAIDYSSPYTHRQSIAGLCAAHGVELTHAYQRPFFLSARYIAGAEDAMAAVARSVAEAFGRRRRARERAARALYQRHLVPVTDVRVTALAAELLPTGAPLPADEGQHAPLLQTPEGNPKEAAREWPLGSRKTVRFAWPASLAEKYRLARQAGPMTAARAAELRQLAGRARVEVSLWRQRTAEERAALRSQRAQEERRVAEAVAAAPVLSQVRQYAESLYARLSQEALAVAQNAEAARKAQETKEKNDEEEDEWEFAVMLDDDVPLSDTQAAEVFLPFVDHTGRRPLQPGTYRVRVRVYDHDVNPTSHPAVTTEGFSAAISVYDAVPSVVGKVLRAGGGEKKAGSEVPQWAEGSQLMPLCAALRAAGLDVPLACEFAAGQALNKKGDFSPAHLLELLRGTRYHATLAERGITGPQKEVEARVRAHWGLSHPGASAEEWAVRRRAVLAHAMERERDWWAADPLLDVADAVTAHTGSGGLEPANAAAVARYGEELCAVLSARGSSRSDETPVVAAALAPSPSSSSSAALAGVAAEATVDGTGALTALHFGGGAAATSAPGVTLEGVLGEALAAVQAAQDRHATLAHYRTAPVAKQTQVQVFCGAHAAEYGGKYARTYLYAADRAREALAAVGAASFAPELEAAAAERLSEAAESSDGAVGQGVDRYASQTHPEQRFTRLRREATMTGQPIDDMTPDAQSTWGS